MGTDYILAVRCNPNVNSGKIVVEAGKSLQFLDAAETESIPCVEDEDVQRIAKALIAYRSAAQELLKGKYAHLNEIAPSHLKDPCRIVVVRCQDGVFVRYECVSEEESRARAGIATGTLAEVAPILSEGLIFFGNSDEPPDSSQLGPGIELGLFNSTGTASPISTFHLRINGSIQFPDGFSVPSPPARPVCLVSVYNEFTVQLGGEVVPIDPIAKADGQNVHQFIAHSRTKLPVGWSAIEVYPILEERYWTQDYTRSWAELDILAIAAQRNLEEKQLNTLDPRSATRKQYAAILLEFENLLAGSEEPLHQFLRQHPELISPTHDKHWSKVPFGATKSDFVMREPYNDYELIEIEAPNRQLFRQDGQQHADLTHAINQITDWVRYIEDNKRTVEVGLSGISTNPRRLVVIGRSSTLTVDNRRKLTTLQSEQPRLRILTYDDLLEGARANLERILGPLGLTGVNAELYFFKKE